jgi:hypothetical protein
MKNYPLKNKVQYQKQKVMQSLIKKNLIEYDKDLMRKSQENKTRKKHLQLTLMTMKINKIFHHQNRKYKRNKQDLIALMFVL